MTKTLTQINEEIEAAENLLRALRDQREAAIIAACPHKVGDVFNPGGREYKVRRVSAGARGRTAYLGCHYKTTAGKWSQGEQIVAIEVDG